LGVDAVQHVRLPAPTSVADVLQRVRQVEHAALAEEQVVVELRFEALPQLQRVLVDRGALVPEVVGADDRGVPCDVPAGEPTALEHGHLGDPVLLREVVRGREAVAAAADDQDVVRRLGLGAPPEKVRVLATHETARTAFLSTPIPSTSISTTSPSASAIFGSRKTPTPSGVPVRITSPGSSVRACEMKLTSTGMVKI